MALVAKIMLAKARNTLNGFGGIKNKTGIYSGRMDSRSLRTLFYYCHFSGIRGLPVDADGIEIDSVC
jgi:hypothetical protein